MTAQVLEVGYPHVMVSRAIFKAATPAEHRSVDSHCTCPTAGTLQFTFLPGDNAPAVNHTVLLSAGCNAEAADTAAAALTPCRHDPVEVNRFLRQCTELTLNGVPYPSAHLRAAPAGNLGSFLLTAPGWSADSGAALEGPQHFELTYC